MIIAIGCSFTHDRFPGIVKPWPEFVGEQLNEKVINLGRNGTGTEYAMRNVMLAYQKYGDQISKIFIGGSEWDRKELPTIEREHPYDGLGYRTSTARPGPGSLGYVVQNHYDRCYYMDSAASHYIAIINFCRSKNIPVVIGQLLWPLQFRSSGDDLDLFKEYFTKSLWNSVDKSAFFGSDWDADKMFIYDPKVKRALAKSKDDLVYTKFNKRRPDLTMGFHDYSEEHKFVFDHHPNEAGHKWIAERFVKKYKELYNEA